MNRNMSRSRNREQRTRPGKNDPTSVTLNLTRRDRERLEEIMRDNRCTFEDIFRVGLEKMSA
ncbi:MAG: hypothetical protein IKO00_06150 [Oscillospiraceae bacterium]|nr:hypothetical protein [Oscillospiraceae bacterium]